MGFVGKIEFNEHVTSASDEVELPSKLSNPLMLTSVHLEENVPLKVPASTTVARNIPTERVKTAIPVSFESMSLPPSLSGNFNLDTHFLLCVAMTLTDLYSCARVRANAKSTDTRVGVAKRLSDDSV